MLLSLLPSPDLLASGAHKLKRIPRICWMRCCIGFIRCWLSWMTSPSLLPTIRPSGIFAWSKFSKRFLAPSAVKMALLPFAVSAATFPLCTSKDALCLKPWLLSSLGILFLLLSPSVDLGCYLLPEEGAPIQLETPVFLHLVDSNAIQVKDPSQSVAMALSAEVHRLLIEAGDEALEVANQRYRFVEAYRNKQQEVYAGTPSRTIRDWLAHFRDAEAAYGDVYIGLLPKTAARGNRNPKADEASRRLLDEAVTQFYARPKQQKKRDVFLLYQRTCLEQNIQPVSERSFYRHLKKISGPALTEKRKGARAAYQESTWYWELERTTPRHGDRTWEIAHIDHTQLDIELLSSLGKPLGRPWATFLVDAYSLDAADRRSEDTQAEGTYRRAISLSRSSGNSATGGRNHPLFILRTNQIGGSSLAGIESPRSAMLNVRFGEQSQVERAIRRDFAASPTQVATSAQCHTLDGTGK